MVSSPSGGAAAFRRASACNSDHVAMTWLQQAHWTGAAGLSSAGIDTAGTAALRTGEVHEDLTTRARRGRDWASPLTPVLGPLAAGKSDRALTDGEARTEAQRVASRGAELKGSPPFTLSGARPAPERAAAWRARFDHTPNGRLCSAARRLPRGDNPGSGSSFSKRPERQRKSRARLGCPGERQAAR
jgi:hypothetical protein